MSAIKLRVLSLGAGVQSSTIALMSARGDLPKVDCAIFADTGWEPKAVYEWLDWLEAQLPYPVIRAQRPGDDLGVVAMAVAAGEKPHSGASLPPFYTANPDGMMAKQCSKEYKTRVVGAAIRKMLGLKPGQRGPKEVVVHSWLGISMDEMERMKDSEQKFVLNCFPLIEARMDRRACLKWMEDRQYPRPPKSSCIFCPYRGPKQWRDMKDNAPEDWAKLCDFDAAIRPGFTGMKGQAFLNRQRVPMSEMDLSTPSEQGQVEFGFLEECEGHCGV